jgi:hypothetical protein
MLYISRDIYFSSLEFVSRNRQFGARSDLTKSLLSNSLCEQTCLNARNRIKKPDCTPLHFKSVINIAPTDILTLVSRYLLICSRRSSLSDFSLCGTTQTDSKAKCLYVLTDRVRDTTTTQGFVKFTKSELDMCV